MTVTSERFTNLPATARALGISKSENRLHNLPDSYIHRRIAEAPEHAHELLHVHRGMLRAIGAAASVEALATQDLPGLPLRLPLSGLTDDKPKMLTLHSARTRVLLSRPATVWSGMTVSKGQA